MIIDTKASTGLSHLLWRQICCWLVPLLFHACALSPEETELALCCVHYCLGVSPMQHELGMLDSQCSVHCSWSCKAARWYVMKCKQRRTLSICIGWEPLGCRWAWPLQATSHCVADKPPQASAAPGMMMGSVRWLSMGIARLAAAKRHSAALPRSLAARPSCSR